MPEELEPTIPVLGGPYNGYSGRQTVTNYKDSENVMTRRILRDSWNGKQTASTIIGADETEYGRILTPFRAVNNLGDYLSRQNYVCGGPNQIQPNSMVWRNRISSIISNCDESGIAAGSGNQRFVSDSSDYIRYKRQSAVSTNYNDSKNGGDQSNGSYTSLMRVRS
jgi:hypothetical protein